MAVGWRPGLLSHVAFLTGCSPVLRHGSGSPQKKSKEEVVVSLTTAPWKSHTIPSVFFCSLECTLSPSHTEGQGPWAPPLDAWEP